MAALAGCGGGKKETTHPPPPKAAVSVYFLLHGKVQPVRRLVAVQPGGVVLGIDPLFAGPSAREKQQGLATAVPPHALKLTVVAGKRRVIVEGHLTWSRPALAQLVYTLTQRAVGRVLVNGKTYTRRSFESETPQILVESPLPNQRIRSPLHAKGTANTFEATFQYELRDLDGKVVARHFVTATSGTGTRGTFDFTTPFSFHHPGMGALVVYELSAEDGSRIHEVEIPVDLTR